MTFKNITSIYTDGSCLKNPGGPSGWCFYLLEKDRHWIVSGSNISSTNNRMELTAIIEALDFAQGNEYHIFTDSQLTMNCAQGKWKRKSNLDLWAQFDLLKRNRILHWTWVKSHNGNKYNEIVDKIARNEAKTINKQ